MNGINTKVIEGNSLNKHSVRKVSFCHSLQLPRCPSIPKELAMHHRCLNILPHGYLTDLN